MSVEIKYKGNTIASASTDTTKTLKTSGKYCEADIEVINTPDGGDAPVINPLSVTENGTYNAPSGVDGYSPVTVNVPQGITPSGSLPITSNGTYDVTQYAEAVVNVSGGGSLPSVISKIDGGSFTLAADTLIADYAIEHTLGVAPTGVLIWSDNEGGAYSVITVSWAAKAVTERAAEVLVDVSTTGTTNYGTQSLTPNGLTSTDFFFRRNNVYYKAGTTYNWIAWV